MISGMENKMNKSEEELELNIEENPNDADFVFTLGDQLLSKNKLDEAIEKYEISCKLDNKKCLDYSFLGRSFFYEHKQDYLLTIKVFKFLIELDPTYWLYFKYLGLSYCHLGNETEMNNAFEKAAELLPLDGYTTWIKSLIRIGKEKEALEKIKILESRYQNRFNIFDETKDSEQIRIRELEFAYERKSECYFIAGLELYKRKSYEFAAENLSIAISINPNEGSYYAAFAKVLMNLNKIDDSLSAIDKAIVLDSRNANEYRDLKVKLAGLEGKTNVE